MSKFKSNLKQQRCGNFSNNIIGDLNTSKAKLRGAKYQREKKKDKAALLTVLPRRKVIINRNVHG